MVATVRSIVSVNEAALYVSFELAAREWKLALTSGFGVKPWIRRVSAGDLAAVARMVREGRRRLGLAETTPVISCYEAGRDGFWIHRALTQLGVVNRVVDSASIDVKRRQRRMKTDRIDAVKLVMMLVRVATGEPDVWAEVRVPSVAVEAARHVSRERTALTEDRTRLRNQITSWLATWGCRVTARHRREPQWWTTVQTWDGAALPGPLQARIARAEARLAMLDEHVATLETAQAQVRRTAEIAESDRPPGAVARGQYDERVGVAR